LSARTSRPVKKCPKTTPFWLKVAQKIFSSKINLKLVDVSLTLFLTLEMNFVQIKDGIWGILEKKYIPGRKVLSDNK
jgi:hypothetical protein